MADIAFLLLIFCLVTTTMDTDSGMIRKLPPDIQDVKPPEVKKRNTLVVLINKNNQLLVEGQNISIAELVAYFLGRNLYSNGIVFKNSFSDFTSSSKSM